MSLQGLFLVFFIMLRNLFPAVSIKIITTKFSYQIIFITKSNNIIENNDSEFFLNNSFQRFTYLHYLTCTQKMNKTK